MPNGIDLLLADHRYVDELFDAFAASGEAAIAGQIVAALTAHDDAEQAVLYPFVGAIVGDAEAVQRSALAHSAVKEQIDRLKFQEGAALGAAVEALRALVQTHVADEEQNILPALADQATPTQLDELGSRILQAKQRGG